MGLFGALLAIPVLALLLVQWAGFQEARVQDAQEVAAGRNLVVLARAVERHVHANFDGTASLRGTVGAGGQLPIAALVGADLLPAGFSGAGDPMKRAVRVRVLDAGGGRLRVVSMQLVEAGDDRRPDAGVFEARAGWLGVVDGGGRLGAAGLGEDLTALRDVDGHPRENALVLYQEFDRESVCGDFLFRTARAGCPDAGRMETDLDLGGNDVTGVARLEADRAGGGGRRGRERRLPGGRRVRHRQVDARRGDVQRSGRSDVHGRCRVHGPGECGRGAGGRATERGLGIHPATGGRELHGMLSRTACGAVLAVLLLLPASWAQAAGSDLTPPPEPAGAPAADGGWAQAHAEARRTVEELRSEIAAMKRIRAAQKELMAWNLERARLGMAAKSLRPELCLEKEIQRWCRLFPATFGIMEDGP